MSRYPSPESPGSAYAGEVVPFPITYGGVVLYGWLNADQRPGRGLENPQGITVVGCNGYATAAQDWGVMLDRLPAEASAAGMDVSMVVFDDMQYFDQASFTGAVKAGITQVRAQVAASHPVWPVGISRGGISAVQAAEQLEPDMVQGLTALATPVGPMRATDGWAVLPWHFLTHRAQMESAEYAGVYRSITDRADARDRAHSVLAAAERDEVTRADIRPVLMSLARRAAFHAGFVHYRQDILVPADVHASRLRAIGSGVAARTLEGTHFTPFVDAASRRQLLSQIGQYSVRVAA